MFEKINSKTLSKIGLFIALLSLIMAIVSCSISWYIYTTGTRPQTEFQRVDVEIERLKEQIALEKKLIEQDRTEGIDVTLRENNLSLVEMKYSDAWKACYIEHDYDKAEILIKESVDILPLIAEFFSPIIMTITIIIVVIVALLTGLWLGTKSKEYY